MKEFEMWCINIRRTFKLQVSLHAFASMSMQGAFLWAPGCPFGSTSSYKSGSLSV